MPILLDPLAEFMRLPKPERRQAAAAAMILGWVHAMQDPGDAGHAAELAALDALAILVRLPIVRASDFPIYDLSALGVRFCRGCGCTDDVGCRTGCHWVSEDTCSRCARIPHRRGQRGALRADPA